MVLQQSKKPAIVMNPPPKRYRILVRSHRKSLTQSCRLSPPLRLLLSQHPKLLRNQHLPPRSPLPLPPNHHPRRPSSRLPKRLLSLPLKPQLNPHRALLQPSLHRARAPRNLFLRYVQSYLFFIPPFASLREYTLHFAFTAYY